MLLFVLLCENYPFKAQVDKELYKKIQYGQFSVPSNISQGSRGLITRILRLNPEKRPSVSDIIKDNWVESNEINNASEMIAEKLPKSSSTGDPFDAEIIFSLVRDMQKRFRYTEEELKIDLQNEKSRASLLYKHFKRSKCETSTGSFNNKNNMSAEFS